MVRTIGWITFLAGPPFVIFLATLSGHRGDAWIAQLAALVDTHAPRDALFRSSKAFISANGHVGEFRIAALLR